MLGNAIYPYFKARATELTATDKNVSEEWLEYLDVRERDGLERYFREKQPDLVLHLAAETDLEFCEENPDIAEATNSRATRAIAELSVMYDATLVYISTAGVFDGKKEGLYTEADEAKPIMVYGRTKLDGECHVREICDKYYVIRAGWMVGGGTVKDHKFVSLILDQILDGRKKIYAVNDRYGTPTYTHDFSINLFRLLDSKRYGTYHMVCEGTGTRFDVAREIVNICGRDDIELIPVDSDYFKERYFAPRPRSEMMINANLRAADLNLMRPWQGALRDYIHSNFPHAISAKQYDRLLSNWSGVERRNNDADRRAPEEDFKVDCRRSGRDRRQLVVSAKDAAVAKGVL
jgi:dTDP-4-dehydrorhamnose reductase